MLQARTRWKLRQQQHHLADQLAKEAGIAPLVASLLCNRGITTKEEAESFLYVEKNAFHDPFLLEGMDIAVARIEAAIKKDEKILIFGDYDADGVSSTTILLKALRQKGAKVDFYIPNRFTEGYGPNEQAFRQAKDNGYSLIITVDTGISALHEAAIAQEIGLDLIITDHHEPQPELPEAIAIVHPKKPGSTYPFHHLAGAGVSLKLAHALLEEIPDELIAIAAIGTVADLVPLIGENRLIAARGLAVLRHTSNPGLRALIKVCGIDPSGLDEESIGFQIGPRINAAGRLEVADPAVHLLMTDDTDEANQLAVEINHLNQLRQQIVNEMTTEAIELVETQFPPKENSVLVVAKSGWNPGVIGITASRLVEKYYRPVIVLSIDEEKGVAKGSARSIAGFDMFKNLSACRDILLYFGGHPMAAGMTLSLANLDELRARLNHQAAEQLSEEDFKPVTEVEILCSIDEINLNVIEQLQLLKPFGVDNPKPKVMFQDATIEDIRQIGGDLTHLKATLSANGQKIDAIGFGFGDAFHEISPLSGLSLIGELSINEWNGFRKPQIMLRDLSVDTWQLFDWRGGSELNKKLQTLNPEKTQFFAFRQETPEAMGLANLLQEEIYFVPEHPDRHLFVNDYFVFLDLPQSLAQMKSLFDVANPERIYAIFYQTQESQFFSTMPTREHFKWYYAFLLKQKTFDLKRHGQELAKRRGWSKDTIEFMSDVFFELGFVTIRNGVISINERPEKKDITCSRIYRMKQEQLEIEKELYYSSYHALKQWFDKVNQRLLFEEAMK